MNLQHSPPDWVGEVVGLMAVHRIRRKDLAERIGVSGSYLSSVLTGAKKSDAIEFKIRYALDEMLEEKGELA